MKKFRDSTVMLIGLCLIGNVVARSAHAEPPPADQAVATQLFEEARALLRQGNVAAACPKFEESERLDPGGGTLLNLALCHEQQGRTATAWVEFTEALGMAKREDRPQRIEFARAHIAQLEPTLARIVIQVPRGGDLPDFEVTRDGSIVASAAWGSPVPFDPGAHVIAASAPGKISWTQTIDVGVGAEAKTVIVPELEDAPVGGQIMPAIPPVSSAAPTPQSETTAPRHKSASPRSPTSAWIALGAGLAATGIATYFALHAIALKSDADRACPDDRCSPQGASQNSDAIRSANLATAGFAIGAVGIGLATVLFIEHAMEGPIATTASAAPLRKGVTGAGISAQAGKGEFTIAGRW